VVRNICHEVDMPFVDHKPSGSKHRNTKVKQIMALIHSHWQYWFDILHVNSELAAT